MFITGASSGIGRALAIRAARAGYGVYAVGRNRAALEALRAKIEGEGGFIGVDATDVALPANARGLVARALAQFGSLDVLVNNAGFVSVGELRAQSDDELQRQFGTHVIGPVALVREALDALRAAHGQVFMLGSGVARVPVGGLGAYPPAKAAVRSATSILRRELRPLGVAVTYVDPGAVDTPFMTRAGMPGAPPNILVSPEAVARKILIAAGTRPRVLNAVAWQTAAVALAELFPRITDLLLERAPSLIGGNAETPPLAHPAIVAAARTEPVVALIPAPPESAPALALQAAAPPFDTALEPLRRRMEKLNLRESFVRDVLVPDTTLDLGEVALRWAGMPNKNERAITQDVLDALADAGFLERSAEQTYRVVRTP
jgi:short-subunit dehydrogenase